MINLRRAGVLGACAALAFMAVPVAAQATEPTIEVTEVTGRGATLVAHFSPTWHKTWWEIDVTPKSMWHRGRRVAHGKIVGKAPSEVVTARVHVTRLLPGESYEAEVATWGAIGPAESEWLASEAEPFATS